MDDATSSPFGPSLQKYWNRRYEYFSRFDEGIRTDAEGLYSVMPEDAALAVAKAVRGAVVLDGFAGIGGSSIGFARAGKRVIAVDVDGDRLRMAEENSKIYGVADRIEFVVGDFMDVVQSARAAVDAVYLDPPWGGPAYKGQDRFLLASFLPDGGRLLSLTLPRFDEVLLRVPENFDLTELESFGHRYTMFDNVSYGRLISRTVSYTRWDRT
ncbi:RsmD family RNA methyltransferase [Sinosporangium siamense]|uniref:Methyltransferase n=1 Tax=Sinosporangium siamense TaxID=1367973 RepID=A0A919REY9_9ACTN|nr:RsmD family RNA methyltransferase [Sinosporangium siamense]GII92393.1 hypothetical protein Ssi02_26240 [Sinosporangium siamense]